MSSWRRRLLASAALLWGLYAVLYSRQYAAWFLDLPFLILALLLWLKRDSALCLTLSLGIAAAVGLRQLGLPALALAGNAAFAAAALARGERWRFAPGKAAAPKSPLRALATAAVFAALALAVARPLWLMVDPKARRARVADHVPAAAPLSPLAERLRGHVRRLAGNIGERSAYQPKAQEAAKDYIVAELRALGLAPTLQEYRFKGDIGFSRKEPFSNIEAVVPGDSAAAWIIAAHYDSAPGTPGADDNASGVAVLLEAARLLKDRKAGREIRLVALGSEEPPAFASRDMGSHRYARGLKESGASVRGVVVLEMLGFFNPAPGSQLYPPFLSWFHPDRADFVGLVSNTRSLGLRRALAASWRRASDFPLESTLLPGPFSSLALSDQLNFWGEGYPAVLLTDTAFFRSPHYHQETDRPETLDYERMARLTEALVRSLD